MPTLAEKAEQRKQFKAVITIGLAALCYVFRHSPVNKTALDAFIEARGFMAEAENQFPNWEKGLES